MHNKKNLKAALSLATSALLGTGTSVSNVVQAAELDEWQFDTAFLLYSEANRVTAGEVIIAGNKTFANDQVLNLKVTIDTLSGASANGAVVQAHAQTFTRPSGTGQYVTPAGEIPLDDTFHDTRVQLNGQWSQTLFANVIDNITGSIGGHLSKEYDYLSLGLNGYLAYDFNKKNSTISMGLSYFNDTLTPEGGIPKSFSSMLVGNSSSPDWDSEFSKTRLGSRDTKATTDILLGFSQVINRRMITAFNYSYSRAEGYLTDPFKIVSVVDNQDLVQDYIYESRPNSRTKQSTFMQAKYHFDKGLFNSVVDLSYRYMWDDWGIKSHTIDSRFLLPTGAASYVEPHIRYYQQGVADFYKPFITTEQLPVTFLSADYRIGEMTAITLGVKYALQLNNGNELSFRLEYYLQKPQYSTEVKAVIAQVSYSF